jgi:hypothetical protein
VQYYRGREVDPFESLEQIEREVMWALERGPGDAEARERERRAFRDILSAIKNRLVLARTKENVFYEVVKGLNLNTSLEKIEDDAMVLRE